MEANQFLVSSLFFLLLAIKVLIGVVAVFYLIDDDFGAVVGVVLFSKTMVLNFINIKNK